MDAARFIKRLIITFGVLASILIIIDWAAAEPAKPVELHVAPTSTLLTTTSTTEAPTATTAAPVAPSATPASATPGCFADLAAQVGWPAEAIPHLTAIIERESHCDPASNTGYRPSTGDWSLGLLQINTLGDLWAGRAAACGLSVREDLLDPAKNLACGLVLYRSSGFGPWGG